ncbi:hypothetical protein FRB95_009378 [Tulasnella sp. JGI-2019a]|nr:hypothetical protein FRB95_009378 [Tulasnella sp. JGI-2019a]
MIGKDFKGGDDCNRGRFGALLSKFMGLGSGSSTTDAPPPYGPGEVITTEGDANALCKKSTLTSPARIMDVNEYGQVVGYISPASTGNWFNFKPAEKALVLNVPIMMSMPLRTEGSSEGFRLRMRNPPEPAVAGGCFLGIQLHRNEKGSETWLLAPCDEGKGPIGNPASSKVWSIHAMEGNCEELRLSWHDKDDAIVPLLVATEKALKREGDSYHFWARRSNDVLKASVIIRLIVERCSDTEGVQPT